MLSDLAPLEMSAPELADARLSGVGSAQTPLRLAQLLPVRSRKDDTYARQDKTSSRDEPGSDDAFSHHSPRFLPHVLHLPLFSEKCICSRPAAAAAKTDLCCPSARCAGGMTKPVHDDDVGKSRNRSTPKCPIIALVNHVKGDKAPKRHPTQRGTHGTVCQTAVIYHADKHIFSLPEETRGCTTQHIYCHIFIEVKQKVS